MVTLWDLGLDFGTVLIGSIWGFEGFSCDWALLVLFLKTETEVQL